MVVCTGFSQVLDKTNAVCAKDMEAQALTFFNRKQLHVAHSIVTDVAAYGLGTTLEAGYNGDYSIRRDKCMMHQTGKLATFGMGTYVYKDGHGRDAFPCLQLKAFNEDFANLEKMYRTKQNSRDLSKAAELHGGCPKLRFRSNFNTTRAAGSMHQHTVALRLKKVIGYFELENPERVTHNFVGDRWIELAEIQAIESVSGGLTMKCQVSHQTLLIKSSFYRRLTTFAPTAAGRTESNCRLLVSLARRSVRKVEWKTAFQDH
jgi:hypothetical protein